MTPSCRFCASKTQVTFSKTLLKKYPTSYYLCEECDLLQTSQPTWLSEAYCDQVAAADTGAMVRNQSNVEVTLGLIRFLGIKKFNRCLDFGGGPGVFTRCMRDLGIPFLWNDKYCENIFAKGFASECDSHFDLITASEVLEHLVDVSGELTTIFRHRPKFVWVNTLLRWDLNPDWWYLSTETGQHVAFYSQKTMQAIAQKFGYRVFPGHTAALFIEESVELEAWKEFLLQKLIYRPMWLVWYGRILQFLAPKSGAADRPAAA